MPQDNKPQKKPVSRRTFLASASVGATAGLAGCAFSEDGTQGTPESEGGNTAGSGSSGESSGENTIRIGYPTTLSGSYATLGEAHLRGTEIAENHINQNSELTIERYWLDNELTSDSAIQNARQLVNQDDVDILAGAVSSSVALALAPVAEELDVPYVSSLNGTGRLTGEDCNSYVFRHNTNAPMGTKAMVLHNMVDKDFETAYYIGSDYSWPRGALEDTRRVLENQGMNPDDVIVGENFAPLDTQDYSTYISDIQNTDADVIFAVLGGTPLVRFVQQGRNFGLFQDKALSGSNFSDVDTFRSLGSDITGFEFITRYTYSIDNQTNRDFVSSYIDEFGEVPMNFGGEGYGVTRAIHTAFENAGEISTDAFIETFSGMEFDSIEGTMNVRECDHQCMSPAQIVSPTSEENYDGPFGGEAESGIYPQIIKQYDGEELARDCSQTGCSL